MDDIRPSHRTDHHRGVVYVATGERYRRECAISAESVKLAMPDVPITVFSDRTFDSPYVDEVRRIENPTFGSLDAISVLPETPYERTLFLDTDTFVDDDLGGIFDMLERFDLTVAIDPIHSDHRPNPAPDVPTDLPEYNTGVIAFAHNERTDAFLEEWERLYRAEPERSVDQPAFRDAIYRSEVNVLTLPIEYNCLYGLYPGYLRGPVKVFHGRLVDGDSFKGLEYAYDPAEIRAALNVSERPRVFTHAQGFRVFVDELDHHPLRRRLLFRLRRDGIVPSARVAWKWSRERAGDICVRLPLIRRAWPRWRRVDQHANED